MFSDAEIFSMYVPGLLIECICKKYKKCCACGCLTDLNKCVLTNDKKLSRMLTGIVQMFTLRLLQREGTVQDSARCSRAEVRKRGTLDLFGPSNEATRHKQLMYIYCGVNRQGPTQEQDL